MSLGTLAINNNSDQVAGTNTSFTVDLKVNDFIAVPSGGVTYTMVVKAIASDTALTITRPFSGPNVTGVNWAAIPAGTMVGVTAKIADDTAYTMRMYVNEANNWMNLLTVDGDVTVYAPDGSSYTGPSWLKLSRIMGSLDMPTLTTIAAQVHTDALQVAADTQTTATNTATATQAAQTATTAAQSASQAAQTATTKARQASASAVTAKNEADRAATANPDNQLKKANNLSDLTDKAAARVNLGLGPTDRVTLGSVALKRVTDDTTYAASGDQSFPIYSTAGGIRYNASLYNELRNDGKGWFTISVGEGTGQKYWGFREDGITTLPAPLVISQGGTGVSGYTRIDVADAGALNFQLKPYGQIPTSFRNEKTIRVGNFTHWNYSPSLFIRTGDTYSTLCIPHEAKGPVTAWIGSDSNGWLIARTFWDNFNTTVDANGFIKKASPIVKLKGDGTADLNEEAEGVTVERLGVGVYKVSGVLGFHSDPAWSGIDGGYSIPQNGNGLPLLWVDYSVEANGYITLRTYHRTHPTAPSFASNLIGIKDEEGNFTETVKEAEPVDIPNGRWIDLRVEMPSDSIYNLKIEEMRKQAEKAEAERKLAEEEERRKQEEALASDVETSEPKDDE